MRQPLIFFLSAFLLFSGLLSGAFPNAHLARAGGEEGFFDQNVDRAESQLRRAFPDIEFNFGENVQNWYKWLLFRAMSAFPVNYMKSLKKISLESNPLLSRGMTSFSFSVDTYAPEVNVRMNPMKFPLQTGFSCQAAARCMRATDPAMNREFFAVAIHELAHAVDLGPVTGGTRESGLSKNFKTGDFIFFNNDPTVARFYPLCFQSAEVLSNECDRDDFVSQYAKTNTFEQFAEAVTVYMLDGENFYRQAKQREEKGHGKLIQQYQFVKDEIFHGKEFRFNQTRKTRLLFTTFDATRRDFPLAQFLYVYSQKPG